MTVLFVVVFFVPGRQLFFLPSFPFPLLCLFNLQFLRQSIHSLSPLPSGLEVVFGCCFFFLSFVLRSSSVPSKDKGPAEEAHPSSLLSPPNKKKISLSLSATPTPHVLDTA